ncbi:MAG: response regulator transcription factor [Chitinophagaceae bacterium]|jgi:DNA-binding NarL/FixJ family response regulator
MIEIVIVEDQPVHQEYLNDIIQNDPMLNCRGIIDNGKEAIFRIPSLKPNLILIDLGLPDIDGISCIKELRSLLPEVKIMVVTVFQDDEHIFSAIKSGANGYLLKNKKPYQICDAIHELYAGGSPISSEIAQKILAHASLDVSNTSQLNYGISKREHEILVLLASGSSYKEIADRCFISINTLKSHIYRIYNKLQAGNRTEALRNFFGPNNKFTK